MTSLTPNSYDDDFLKRWLDRHLWGYPKLVDACPFSVLADVRRKNLEEREKILGSLPAIYSESAPDASGGRPGGGDIAQDPSLPHSPPHEDQAFTNENVNSDIHGVYTNVVENHPEDDSEQSVMQSVQGSVGEIVADRHSVPYDTEHTQE